VNVIVVYVGRILQLLCQGALGEKDELMDTVRDIFISEQELEWWLSDMF
jgi:hypothetical protein